MYNICMYLKFPLKNKISIQINQLSLKRNKQNLTSAKR